MSKSLAQQGLGCQFLAAYNHRPSILGHTELESLELLMAQFEEKQESSVKLTCGDCGELIADSSGLVAKVCGCQTQDDVVLTTAGDQGAFSDASAPSTKLPSSGPSTYNVKVPTRTAIKDKKESPPRQRVLVRILRIVILFQLLPWGFLWVVTPGYIAPFLRSASVQLVLLGLVIWQVFGILLHLRRWKESEYPTAMQWLILIALFMVPLALAPWFGPFLLR